MKNHILLVFVVLLVFQVALAANLKTKPVSVTGWVSDEGCGAMHAKPGGEDCVLKCLKGGAHVGHPEWKPQRMVFVTDDGHKIWIVINPAALKGLEGKHIRLDGHLNQATRKVRVTTASEIKDA